MRGNRDELIAMLGRFPHAAWGWECQGIYAEPHGPVEAWERGEGVDSAAMREYLAASRAITATGRTVDRVWVHSDPPTVYERWQLDAVEHYRDAGERIRLITENEALELGLPDYDFWIFGDELVAVLEFERHAVAGAELIDDPVLIRPYLDWRALVEQHARDPVPLARSA